MELRETIALHQPSNIQIELSCWGWRSIPGFIGLFFPRVRNGLWPWLSCAVIYRLDTRTRSGFCTPATNFLFCTRCIENLRLSWILSQVFCPFFLALCPIANYLSSRADAQQTSLSIVMWKTAFNDIDVLVMTKLDASKNWRNQNSRRLNLCCSSAVVEVNLQQPNQKYSQIVA